MTLFYYKAATAAGEWKEGATHAANETDVVARLRDQNLIPTYVGLTPRSEKTSHHGSASNSLSTITEQVKRWNLPLRTRSVAKDRLEFTHELSTLLGAGVPVDRALLIVSRLTTSEHFRTVIEDVLRQIRAGASLADALETHRETFSKLYVNMTRAGQAGGTLAEVFERLADYEARESEIRSHVISSLIYPALLTVVALASMFVMMYFVVPRFEQVFASTGAPRPPSTAALLWVGSFVRTYGILIVIAVVALGFSLLRWFKSTAGREQFDQFVLAVPVLSSLIRKGETARFARTMATLLRHGVPIVESLRIVRETIGNTQIAGSFEGIIQGVKRGEGISGPISRTKVFPALALQLMQIGEETGKLDSMFERLAIVYDDETRTAIRRMTALFEPAVIVIMGITIGAIVLSLLMAISSINEIPL
jgi:general secretion pathway protein F